MIDKKHSSKRSIKLDICQDLRKLIDSIKYSKGEPDRTTLEIVLNKIEAIQKKKKRIEVLTEVRDYYQKELQQKEKELRDKIEYDTALKDRLKSDKSDGMLRYGRYDDLK
jgi:hypothetical protein